MPPTRLAIIAEAAAAARAARIPSLLIGLVVAGVCLSAMLIAGRSAASEAAVIAHIQDAGTRLIVVSDEQRQARIPVAAVSRVAALSDVAWAVGFGAVTVVRNTALGGGGAPAASRPLYGRPPPQMHLLAGRLPAAGEAVVTREAMRTLGLQGPVGDVTTGTVHVAIVGLVQLSGALSPLDGSVLIGTGPGQDALLSSMYVLATDAQDVSRLAPILARVSGAQDTSKLTVQTSVAPDLLT